MAKERWSSGQGGAGPSRSRSGLSTLSSTSGVVSLVHSRPRAAEPDDLARAAKLISLCTLLRRCSRLERPLAPGPGTAAGVFHPASSRCWPTPDGRTRARRYPLHPGRGRRLPSSEASYPPDVFARRAAASSRVRPSRRSGPRGIKEETGWQSSWSGTSCGSRHPLARGHRSGLDHPRRAGARGRGHARACGPARDRGGPLGKRRGDDRRLPDRHAFRRERRDALPVELQDAALRLLGLAIRALEGEP